ncbi:MAG: type II toxin-antitoxin system VapC family toxin [Actinomycetota bacterium]|nr:type II toxin-antitoxin system VapC family toxin [Actinomycetota bacterium]
MNIIDSSGWLTYFADAPNAEHFLIPLDDPDSLVVPTITIFEVFKVVLRECDENKALQAIAAMQKGMLVALGAELAATAAKVSLEQNLPMADSIILATAKQFDATIWTEDSDFRSLPNVRYFPKR